MLNWWWLTGGSKKYYIILKHPWPSPSLLSTMRSKLWKSQPIRGINQLGVGRFPAPSAVEVVLYYYSCAMDWPAPLQVDFKSSSLTFSQMMLIWFPIFIFTNTNYKEQVILHDNTKMMVTNSNSAIADMNTYSGNNNDLLYNRTYKRFCCDHNIVPLWYAAILEISIKKSFQVSQDTLRALLVNIFWGKTWSSQAQWSWCSAQWRSWW